MDALELHFVNKHGIVANINKKTIMKCECGSEIQKTDVARHKKSQKHIKYVNNLQNENNENL